MNFSKFDIHDINQRGLFIAPGMTMRSYLKKYPLAALFLDQHLADDRERLLAEGFDGYVAKPFQLPQLAAELARVTTG